MAFKPLVFVPNDTHIDFIGKRWLAFIFSSIAIIGTILLIITRGMNFGIDFTGGVLIEAGFDHTPDLANMRTLLKNDIDGDVSLQEFGSADVLMIRIGQKEGTEAERLKNIDLVKKIFTENFDGKIDYRKVEYVGPKVGTELIEAGAFAIFLALIAIMIYIWVRFEWQFGIGAIVALFHDVILTIGFFSLTQLEFNLASVAAVLTIVGYSINDTVVVFDRVRENLRRYKKTPLAELLNTSVNQMLNRTVMTSVTTILALAALVWFGGAVVQSFSLAALWGVVIGTYSSVYIASPILMFTSIRKADDAAAATA